MLYYNIYKFKINNLEDPKQIHFSRGLKLFSNPAPPKLLDDAFNLKCIKPCLI